MLKRSIILGKRDILNEKESVRVSFVETVAELFKKMCDGAFLLAPLNS